jgi:UDP-D-galactose:(glucosyl)LPS alpha-1,6-D-galactosyltransferase
MAGIKGVPVICWLHCSYKYQKMQNEVARADANLCICQERADEVRQLLQQSADGSAGKPVFLVYSGTSEGSKPAIPRSEAPAFVFAGRIQYEGTKRIKDLIEAAGRLRGEFRIKLLGDGYEGEKEKIRNRARELGMADRIEWLGWRKDAWSAVGEASAMVLPSDSEGFSMVTIEALARGLPVILSDFGGISKEAVLPGETGWMFPVADVNSLAAILQSIVDNPAILPDADAIRRFARKFSTEQMVVNFREAVREVAGAERIA